MGRRRRAARRDALVATVAEPRPHNLTRQQTMTAEVKPQPTSGTGEDPSMEDILASIRRILTEEQTPEPPAAPTNPAPEPVANEDVLVLDSSMMIADPQEADAQPAQEPSPAEPPASVLVAPEVAAAAASSVGSLIRTL